MSSPKRSGGIRTTSSRWTFIYMRNSLRRNWRLYFNFSRERRAQMAGENVPGFEPPGKNRSNSPLYKGIAGPRCGQRSHSVSGKPEAGQRRM